MSATVETPQLLVALLAPLVGAVLVMLNKRRPNLRETCSLLAACVTFGTVLTLLRPVLAGQTLAFHLFSLLPGGPKM